MQDPNFREENPIAQTDSELGINPIVFIIVVATVALVVVLPVTVMIVKRSGRRNLEEQRFTTEGSNAKSTAHVSNEDGSNESVGQSKDGQFV